MRNVIKNCPTLPLLALTACVGAGEASPVAVAETVAPIINGTSTNLDSVGVVAIRTADGRLCSGTLLTNSAVLTAAKCFSWLDLTQPGQVSVKLQNGKTQTAANIAIHPDGTAALMYLAGPIEFNFSTVGHYTPVFSADPDLLEDKLLDCYGWGRTVQDGANPTVLRWASLFVDGASSSSYDLASNSKEQTFSSGDMGGPCTYVMHGVEWLTGFHDDTLEDVATPSVVEWLYSHKTSTSWPGLFASDIDAAVAWPDGKAYFFKGDQYIRWNIAKDELDDGFPASISKFWPGLFSSDIDAAAVFPNGKAYFFKGDQYIRWDIEHDHIDAGFPASIEKFWPGLFTSDIDAVVVHPNGKAYFFKGDQYIRWDITHDHVDQGFPAPISQYWKGMYPEDIDAIATWPNGKAYVFKGARYERYDLKLDHADLY